MLSVWVVQFESVSISILVCSVWMPTSNCDDWCDKITLDLIVDHDLSAKNNILWERKKHWECHIIITFLITRDYVHMY